MRDLLQSIYPYLFLFFCFVLPLDKYATAVPNIVLISLIVLFPFVVRKSDFKKLLKLEVYLLVGLICYVLLNNMSVHDFESDMVVISKLMSSFLLIFLFIPLKNTVRLKKTILASVVIAIVISLYHLYWFYTAEGEFNFATGGIIDEVLIVDRLYLGLLCVLSIIMSIDLIGNKYNDNNKWYFANIVLCVLFVLLISSRSAILLLLAVFFLKILYTRNKKQHIVFFLGVALVSLLAFVFNDNLKERFFYTNSTQKEKSYIELFQQWEPRVVIWDCNYRIIQRDAAYLGGLGFYNSKKKLSECYGEIIEDKEKRAYFLREGFNSHNQFFDFLLSAGILGLLLFASIFVVLLYKRKANFSSMALLLSIILFAMVENFFHRQLGAYYFGIIMILLVFDGELRNNKKKLQETEN